MPPRASSSSSTKNAKDRAPALLSLSTLSEFLTVQAKALSLPLSDSSHSSRNSNGDESSSSTTAPSIAIIISDLHSLFTILAKETTSLSLAFAPPKESWDAVLTVSKTLVDLSSKIVHALSLLHTISSTHHSGNESLLTKEWRFAIVSCLEALKDLIDTCHTTYIDTPVTSTIKPQERKQILTQTSIVWKTIERTNNSAETEVEAFKNAWKGIIELLEDALQEVTEITEREVEEVDNAEGKGKVKGVEEVNGKSGEDGSDDSFGLEDDDDEDETISPGELQVAQAALQSMKLVRALFKKVSILAKSLKETTLSRLHILAQSLMATHDDLASALYPPQNLPEIMENTIRYKKISLELIQEILAYSSEGNKNGVAALSQATEDLAISEQNSKGTKTSSKEEEACGLSEEQEKWCRACQAQFQKTAQVLLDKCQLPGR